MQDKTLDAVPVCHWCRQPLYRDGAGQLHYWTDMVANPDMPGGVLSVKVHAECSIVRKTTERMTARDRA